MKFSSSAVAATFIALLAPVALGSPVVPHSDDRTVLGEPIFATAPLLEDRDLSPLDDGDYDIEARSNGKHHHHDHHHHEKRNFPFRQVILDHHNAHRKNHSAPALVYNTTMEDNAKVLAQRCVWHHDTTIGGGGYGQNLAAGFKRRDIGNSITGGWYGEAPAYKDQYGLDNPTNFGSVGHFTQLVWLTTKAVGCFTYNCAQKGHLKDTDGNVLANGLLDNFTVCNYYPPGNWGGEFGKNVLKPIGLPPYTGP